MSQAIQFGMENLRSADKRWDWRNDNRRRW